MAGFRVGQDTINLKCSFCDTVLYLVLNFFRQKVPQKNPRFYSFPKYMKMIMVLCVSDRGICWSLM